MSFIMTLMNIFPHFAERKGNSFVQQDAEECFSGMLSTLDNTALATTLDETFAYETVTTLTTKVNDKDLVETKVERNRKLNCYLEQEGKGNASHILEGIRFAMEGTLQKRDEESGLDLVWNKSTKLNSMPKYMVIHMVRFFYKQAIQTKAKILRSCPFNKTIDLHELCSDELKAQLKDPRQAAFESTNKIESDGWRSAEGVPYGE